MIDDEKKMCCIYMISDFIDHSLESLLVEFFPERYYVPNIFIDCPLIIHILLYCSNHKIQKTFYSR